MGQMTHVAWLVVFLAHLALMVPSILRKGSCSHISSEPSPDIIRTRAFMVPDYEGLFLNRKGVFMEIPHDELALKEYEALQAEKRDRMQARRQIWSVVIGLIG